MIQQTLCLIKPDATKRHLIGKILSHLEEKEYKIIKFQGDFRYHFLSFKSVLKFFIFS